MVHELPWVSFDVSGVYAANDPETDSEKLPSAIDRYGKEIKRVLSVIDAHLKKTGQQYLVGDKFTYADLSFIPWNWLLPIAMGQDFDKELEKDLPNYWAWWQKVSARPAAEKVRKDREAALAKGH